MNPFSFDYIWDKFIVMSVNNFLCTITEENLKKYNVKIVDISKAKKQVYEEYEKSIKMLGTINKESLSNVEIDEHKIAACLCYSLIKQKLINFTIEEDLPAQIFFSNYTIAFNVSVSIIFSYLIFFYNKIGEKTKLELLRKNGTLFLPSTNSRNDTLDVCIIKTLAQNDLDGKEFDYLLYATIMFLIEEFNIQYLNNI